MIERNKHHPGRLGNMLFGLVVIGDGLVRILSFGHLHTRFASELSRIQAKRLMTRQLKKRLKALDQIERRTKGLKK